MVCFVQSYGDVRLALGDRPALSDFMFFPVNDINLVLGFVLTYIFELDFSRAMASSVSPSTLISASFLPAVVSTTLTIEYVWWISPPPLSMYKYFVSGSYPMESASSSNFTLESNL